MVKSLELLKSVGEKRGQYTKRLGDKTIGQHFAKFFIALEFDVTIYEKNIGAAAKATTPHLHSLGSG